MYLSQGLLGREYQNCRWVKMGENWYQWVCFTLNGVTSWKPTGKVMFGAAVQNSNGTSNGNGSDTGASGNMLDTAVNWVKQNPVAAAGIGIAAYFLFLK